MFVVHSCLDLEIQINSESNTGSVRLGALAASSLSIIQKGNLTKLEVYSDATKNILLNSTALSLRFISPGNDVSILNSHWAGKATIAVDAGNLNIKDSSLKCKRKKAEVNYYPSSDCSLVLENIKRVQITSTKMANIVFDTALVQHINIIDNSTVDDMMWHVEGRYVTVSHDWPQRHCKNTEIKVSNDSKIAEYYYSPSCQGNKTMLRDYLECFVQRTCKKQQSWLVGGTCRKKQNIKDCFKLEDHLEKVHRASAFNQAMQLELLIDDKEEIERKMTAESCSFQAGVLLDDKNIPQMSKQTALMKAVRKNAVFTTELLISKVADFCSLSDQNETIFHFWASGNSFDLTHLLVANFRKNCKDKERLTLGIDALMNERNSLGASPLHLAAGKDVAEVLLKHSSDVQDTDHDSRTPLHYAATYGYEDVARLLLEKGAAAELIDDTDNLGWTPLHLAVKNGRDSMTRLLLEKGAKVDAVGQTLGNFGQTPLHVAALSGHDSVARLLLEKGAEVNAPDYWGRTPLHEAAKHGHYSMAVLLLEEGAAVDATDKYGQTPLKFATMNGHDSVAKLLLEKMSHRG